MSYGRIIEDAIIGAIALAFGVGILVAVALWALWHFVVSHLRVIWV